MIKKREQEEPSPEPTKTFPLLLKFIFTKQELLDTFVTTGLLNCLVESIIIEYCNLYKCSACPRLVMPFIRSSTVRLTKAHEIDIKDERSLELKDTKVKGETSITSKDTKLIKPKIKSKRKLKQKRKSKKNKNKKKKIENKRDDNKENKNDKSIDFSALMDTWSSKKKQIQCYTCSMLSHLVYDLSSVYATEEAFGGLFVDGDRPQKNRKSRLEELNLDINNQLLIKFIKFVPCRICSRLFDFDKKPPPQCENCEQWRCPVCVDDCCNENEHQE
jgi:hypothetical protein